MHKTSVLRSTALVLSLGLAAVLMAPPASAVKLKGKINNVSGTFAESKVVASSKKKSKKKLSIGFVCKRIKNESEDPSCPRKRFSATIKRDPEDKFHYLGKARVGREKCEVDAYAYSNVLMATITCEASIYSINVKGKDRDDDDDRR